MPEYVVDGAEDGVSTGVNTAWDADQSATLSFIMFPNSTERMGLRFQGLPTQAVGTDSQCPVRFSTVSFRLVPTPAIALGTIRVYVVDETDPPAFSNSRVPGSGQLVEKLVATYNPVVLGFQQVTITLDIGVLGSVYTKTGWLGNLALTMHWESTAGFLVVPTGEGVTFAPDLITDDGVPLISGLDGPVDAMSRVDRCPKCVEISPRENWVRDGWSKRLVCTKCYDPDDPLRRRRRLPLEKPGINDRG